VPVIASLRGRRYVSLASIMDLVERRQIKRTEGRGRGLLEAVEAMDASRNAGRIPGQPFWEHGRFDADEYQGSRVSWK
jgi:hypothetical protein